MNTPDVCLGRAKLRHRLLVFAVGLVCATGWLGRSQPATGIIEGRISSSTDNRYLERAQVLVEGTSIATFSDADGDYILSGVPAGTVKVRVFYTGHVPHVEEVEVSADQTTQRDIVLSPVSRRGEAPRDGAAVQLKRFVVDESRDMDAAALAINEQRFAPNVVNVVSTEEFGSPVEGNVAEFLKYLPGIQVEEITGTNRRISIDGVPSANVPIQLGGFSLASAIEGGGGADASTRTVEVDMISLNNLSRVEVSFSPTPESPGDALAGTVKLVPRSAFERSRPQLKINAFITMEDNAKNLTNRTPGPQDHPTYKAHPGFDLSYVVPLTKDFGFTISLNETNTWKQLPFGQNQWRGGNAATNGVAFPNTTPALPYNNSFTNRNDSNEINRQSLGLTFDYRFSVHDRVSLGYQLSVNNILESNHTLSVSIDRVTSFGIDANGLGFTRGAAGMGTIQSSSGYNDRINRVYMPTFTWRHDGPTWKAEAGVGHSHAANHFRDISYGHFGNSISRLTGVTVNFDDVFYLYPQRISVTNAAGSPVDIKNLANYTMVSGNSQEFDNEVTQQTAYANVARHFFRQVPLTLKAGLDFRRATRDVQHPSAAYTVNGTPNAAPFISASASQAEAPFGFGQPQYPSPTLFYQSYVASPNGFTRNATNEYTSRVNGSLYTNELISAGYVRGDVSLLDARLKFVGGVRAEQTNIKAQGPLTDPTRNFQRDANGNIVRGSNGVPLTIVPATDALGVARLTQIERGSKVEKDYIVWLPSLNASYNIRDNLIARAAYFESIGRPDNAQYAGAMTLPNLTATPSASNSIRVNNADIKPWSAKSVVVRLEYYFQNVGLFSIGGFRRNITDAFGATTFTATPEFLSLYNLDPSIYGLFDVRTNTNLPGVLRLEGLNFNYKQALTFLPRWARGVQVFVNGSSQRVTGANSAAFTDLFVTPRSGSWGFSLTRERFNVHANWTFQSKARRAQSTVNLPSIEDGTFRWVSQQIKLDLLGELRLYKNYSLFANLRNFTAVPGDTKIYGPHTNPLGTLRQREPHNSVWTFGVKATF